MTKRTHLNNSELTIFKKNNDNTIDSLSLKKDIILFKYNKDLPKFFDQFDYEIVDKMIELKTKNGHEKNSFFLKLNNQTAEIFQYFINFFNKKLIENKEEIQKKEQIQKKNMEEKKKIPEKQTKFNRLIKSFEQKTININNNIILEKQYYYSNKYNFVLKEHEPNIDILSISESSININKDKLDILFETIQGLQNYKHIINNKISSIYIDSDEDTVDKINIFSIILSFIENTLKQSRTDFFKK